MLATVRNIAIVLAIAAVIAIVPGGGTAAGIVGTALSLAFLAAAAWVASIVYRQHRDSIYLLGDRRRAVFYLALVVLVVTLTATGRLWQTPAGEIAWLVLIGAGVYAIAAVVWAARRQQ
ncbi:MAG TPA: hypothetical protein VKV27_15065 [Solirubrobacteraceae bacterium]|nr:hypothetical protein [Solirubrobacteraceae bacterium]